MTEGGLATSGDLTDPWALLPLLLGVGMPCEGDRSPTEDLRLGFPVEDEVEPGWVNDGRDFQESGTPIRTKLSGNSGPVVHPMVILRFVSIVCEKLPT